MRLTQTAMLGLVSVTLACGGGHVVKRAEVPQLGPQQGFIALALDTNRRTTVTLCRDADMAACVGFRRFGPRATVKVGQVPAGRYCLASIVAEALSGAMGFVQNYEQETTSCFDVRPGVIAYPGHLIYRVQATQTTIVHIDGGWEKRDTIEAELRAVYPNLKRWPVATVATGGVR